MVNSVAFPTFYFNLVERKNHHMALPIAQQQTATGVKQYRRTP
jgi:hypothetical protein